MPNKTFFKDGQALVIDSLQGLCSVSPELVFNRPAKGKDGPVNPLVFNPPISP